MSIHLKVATAIVAFFFLAVVCAVIHSELRLRSVEQECIARVNAVETERRACETERRACCRVETAVVNELYDASARTWLKSYREAVSYGPRSAANLLLCPCNENWLCGESE